LSLNRPNASSCLRARCWARRDIRAVTWYGSSSSREWLPARLSRS